ncbi:deoxynucleotide monophosphate kinase family protein [Crossiella sp. NPDC003009]
MSTLPTIGLIAPARSGKDTVADYLRQHYGYRRLAVADPVREALLALDPLIPWGVAAARRLSWLVGEFGWDAAKQHREVRRLLQRLGTDVVRDIVDRDAWVKLAARRLTAEPGPWVITDLRFANEVFLADTLWRIHRPSIGPVNDHVSEHELSEIEVDHLIRNEAGRAHLEDQVHRAMVRVLAEA